MDEQCFRPLFCTVKAELGCGQPGLSYLLDSGCFAQCIKQVQQTREEASSSGVPTQ